MILRFLLLFFLISACALSPGFKKEPASKNPKRIGLEQNGVTLHFHDINKMSVGGLPRKAEIQKNIKKLNGPNIVDEAYGEFSDYSVVNLVRNNDNLIVIRTFSKAFGLAGLRLGYFVANKRFTDIFSRIIQYPYPLNSLAIEAGILALQKSKQVSSIFSLIKKERERVIKNLKGYDIFDVFDSKANYVLFDATGSDSRVYNALAEQGISIRKLGKLGKHRGCLRVTIGTKEMNSKFLLAIRDLVQ